MVNAPEAYQLVVAAVITPLIIRSLRSIELPGTRPIAVGIIAMALAFIFTVIEGFVAPSAFNTLEHAMYAISGVAFLWSAIDGAVYWFSRGRERG